MGNIEGLNTQGLQKEDKGDKSGISDNENIKGYHQNHGEGY